MMAVRKAPIYPVGKRRTNYPPRREGAPANALKPLRQNVLHHPSDERLPTHRLDHLPALLQVIAVPIRHGSLRPIKLADVLQVFHGLENDAKYTTSSALLTTEAAEQVAHEPQQACCNRNVRYSDVYQAAFMIGALKASEL